MRLISNSKILTMHKSSTCYQEESSFKKHLSKFSCLMLGIGGLIGGGIFSVIGVISIYTGPYSYLSYLITGIIAIVTVYSYQKLSFKWNGPGGEYSTIQGAFKGTKLENLSIFPGLLLCFGYIASMALYSYTFSVYFLLLFNIEYNYLLLSFIIIIIFFIFTFLNLKRVKESIRLQNILVMIKILILVLFSILGIIYAFKTPEQVVINLGLDNNSLGKLNFGGIIIGSASVIVSYQGFQLIAYGSHEMEDIKGGLKMMRWSILISIIIYCSVSFTAVAILGVSGLIGEGSHNAEVAIANAALNFMGAYGKVIITIGALLSTASALNATIFGCSRLVYIMGKERILPKHLSFLNKNKVPRNAILFISILSVIFTISTGGALAITGVVGLIFTQIFFIINFTNFKVKKQTESKRIIPLIGMVLTASFFSILLIHNIINIETELISLTFFLIMEITSVVLIFHINRNKYRRNN